MAAIHPFQMLFFREQAWGHTFPVAAASAFAAPRKRGRPWSTNSRQVIVDGKKLRRCWELRKGRKEFPLCAHEFLALYSTLYNQARFSLIARSGGL